MRRKNKIDKKYIVLIIIGSIILLLALFAFTLRDERKLNPVEKIIKDSVYFVTNIVTYPFDYIAKNINEFIVLKDVYKENEILKQNIDRYDYIYTQNQELKRQNDEMKKLLDIEYTIDEYDYINASIIERNLAYWYDTITINKGSSHGIEKNMAVITSNGLIGKVTKTSYFTSDVKLITSNNSNNKISVLISNKDKVSYGVLSGYDEEKNLLLIEGISDTTKIENDSLIYTSGLNNMLPSGILIGKVKTTTKDSYGLSIIVKATPSSNPNDLVMVSILKRKGEK